ncbi:primosomal protein N' [Winogradskyella sp. PC-19]|uniref:replication restart helicase PriA n=1 Tax=unclassified Winogradskyella TaxID=2615021 RepID=UPI000B3BF80D|nr:MULTISPECIES: primosomal protein N' [unclassified Winogradskyella]ARV08171.1 primosomal protein N' [Winogradskyella sp. PC-19]RZN77101.1 MAG: primosomal protein N' [Winogradskyella sp.]
MNNHFIDVILPIPLQKAFTYHITEAEAEFLKPGIRVAVPFGKSKIYTALAYKIHNKPPIAYEAKTIHQILDDKPLVTEKQLEHWQWIASYYMCSLGEVMRAAIPNAFIIESETIISKVEDAIVNDSELKDEEFLIYEALHHQSSLKIQDVISILDKKRVLPIINGLVEKGIIQLQEEIYQKYTPKLVRYVRLHEHHKSEDKLQKLLELLNRAKKQRDVVLTLFQLEATSQKAIKVTELVEKSGASSAIIKTLIDKKILEEYHIQTDRVNFEGEAGAESKQLNEYQQKAFEEINTSFEEKSVVLLHGVTSSGKTEIYIKLIEKQLEQQKQVLYLLPEIALTTQLVSRLQDYFGEKVAVFHSRYSGNERVEAWNNILNNSEKAQIIIGARSSLLLPFRDLGLIIVDEEHEQSYKQFDPAPRYHARDAAIVLANMFNAKTLLGTATPSLETYYNTSEGKYGLVEITKRYNDVLMPEIELVDLADKYKRKRMKGHFSDRLIEEMTEAFEEGFQVILFQNRRGFSPIVECTTCGNSPQCPNCDVSLTYHQYRDQLRCHYCGYNSAMLKSCQACGNITLDTKGFGTEQIEEEVKALFPDRRVARMDLDTTRGKYGFEKLITRFEQREIDVLVGTQMITKGLDFRYVKLVGILNADNLLNFPDFRAHERSYQLMAQVSGRAGRTDLRGKVLIQTYNPHHNILQQVSTNSYTEMYKEQLNDRYNYKYPPIFRLIKVTLKHKDYNRVNLAADWYAKSLKLYFKTNVLGPEFPPVSRIRNLYHKNILIKIPQNQSLPKTKEAIARIDNSFNAVKDFRSVRVIINVDNY